MFARLGSTSGSMEVREKKGPNSVMTSNALAAVFGGFQLGSLVIYKGWCF